MKGILQTIQWMVCSPEREALLSPARRRACIDLVRAELNVSERPTARGLLSQIGRDCIGALQFLPDGQEPQPMSELNGEVVNEAQIAAILSDLDLAPLGIRRENDFRISVAGAQEKTALLRKEGKWIVPTGTTPTTHIIKP